jgi:serine/threonine protein kinase
VLLDERHRCKIADFGLARESDSAGEAFYQARGARRLPVRLSLHSSLPKTLVGLGCLLDLQVLPHTNSF